MLLPLLLSGLLLYYSFMGLELQYSTDRLFRGLGADQELAGGDAGLRDVSADEDKSQVKYPGVRELSDAANDPRGRNYWDGQSAQLKGVFAPLSDKEFVLFRLKMTCCASDAVPMKVRIFSKTSLASLGLQRGKGAVATGQVQFRKIKDSDEYVPILVATDIKPAELGSDLFDRGN